METAIKIRAGDRNAWIANLSRVSALEYNITTAMPGGGVFNDLGPDVLHEKMRVTFRAKATHTKVSKRIIAFFKKYPPERGKVEGKDAHGRDVSFPLINPPGIYKMLDYDSTLKNDFIDTSAISASELFRDMVYLAMSEEAEFGPKPPQPKKEKT